MCHVFFLKVLGDLKADNQRLKDENAALIRVISKLSRWAFKKKNNLCGDKKVLQDSSLVQLRRHKQRQSLIQD